MDDGAGPRARPRCHRQSQGRWSGVCAGEAASRWGCPPRIPPAFGATRWRADALDRGSRPVLGAFRDGGRLTILGHHDATLFVALETRLGHRRFRRLTRPGRYPRALGGGRHRPQPVARIVPGQSGACEPLFTGKQTAAERAQHRRGAARRSIEECEGEAAARLAGVPPEAFPMPPREPRAIRRCGGAEIARDANSVRRRKIAAPIPRMEGVQEIRARGRRGVQARLPVHGSARAFLGPRSRGCGLAFMAARNIAIPNRRRSSASSSSTATS